MRLPAAIKQIQGVNKFRDLAICLEYISGKMPSEIAADRNHSLTVRRIEQIISTNAAFVNPRVAWPKSKRVHLRQWLIEKKLHGTDQFSNKDVVDQLNSLREEIEGDKPLIDQSTHTHYTITDLAEQLAAEKNERIRNDALISTGTNLVLPKSLGGESLDEASRDHELGEGQSKDNGSIG